MNSVKPKWLIADNGIKGKYINTKKPVTVFAINNMAIPSQANYESIGRCRE